jgi:hypothetical protein
VGPNEVLWNTTAIPVHQPETELGSSVALFGSPFVPSGCLGEVLWCPDADVVSEAELVLGFSIAALGVPAQCVGAVLRLN